jgi:hypothetical protein
LRERPVEVELLKTVEPEEVALYLQRTGWSQRRSVVANAVEWVRWNATKGKEFEILMPAREDKSGDYVSRVADAIQTLSAFEARPWTEILSDLKNSDVRATLRRRPSRGWREELVSLLGLDVFGLVGLSSRAFEALFSLAILIWGLFIGEFLLMSALFSAVMGGYGIGIGLGFLSALTSTLFTRNVIISSARRSAVNILIYLVFSICSWSISSPVIATMVLRGPIERQLHSEHVKQAPTFIEKWLALHRILDKGEAPPANSFSKNERRTIRIAYWMCMLVSGGIWLLPIPMRFMAERELRAYFETDWDTIGFHPANEKEGVKTASSRT